MPTNRKLLGAAAFSLALAGGGAAGALLGTPILSGAQDSTQSTATTTVDDPAADAAFHGPGAHRGEGLAVAAKAIGISEAELRTALEGGKSVAQVAESEGVDVQTVIDALVADGTKRLEAMIDKLPDRVTAAVNHEGLPDRGGHGGPGGPHGGRGPGLEAAAKAIGISAEDLRTALEGGQTVAEVADAKGVEVQTVVDALVAEATTHLDQAVTDGRITEAEATQRKADLETRITAFVNGERPAGGPDGGGAPGGV